MPIWRRTRPCECGCTTMAEQYSYLLPETDMKEEVEKVIQTIRPALQADGGDVELVDVVDGVVKVRLRGACGGCPMAAITLKNGIEARLKQEIPEVKSVEQVQ